MIDEADNLLEVARQDGILEGWDSRSPRRRTWQPPVSYLPGRKELNARHARKRGEQRRNSIRHGLEVVRCPPCIECKFPNRTDRDIL